MFDGDTVLTWRPTNIFSIGLLTIGWLLVFAILGQVFVKFQKT